MLLPNSPAAPHRQSLGHWEVLDSKMSVCCQHKVGWGSHSLKGPPSPHLSILAAQREKQIIFMSLYNSTLPYLPQLMLRKIKLWREQNKTKRNAWSVSHKMRCFGLCEFLLMVKLERGSLKPQTNFAVSLLHNETGNKERGKMMMEPFLSLWCAFTHSQETRKKSLAKIVSNMKVHYLGHQRKKITTFALYPLYSPGVEW